MWSTDMVAVSLHIPELPHIYDCNSEHTWLPLKSNLSENIKLTARFSDCNQWFSIVQFQLLDSG